MLRIEDTESGDFAIYKVKYIECNYLGPLKKRVNITIIAEGVEIKLRAATEGDNTAKMAAEKISSSICQNISVIIFEGRGSISIYDTLAPVPTDETSFQLIGGRGHLIDNSNA